jgi:hypothetical protein
VGLLLAVSGLVLQFHVLPRYTLLEPLGRGVSALLVLGGLFVALAASPLALFSLVVTLYLWAALAVLPGVNVYKSARGFCEAVNEHVAADQALRAYRPWKWRAGYSYYTGRTILSLGSLEELASYWSGPEPVFLVVEQGELGEARAVLGDAEPLVAAPVGGNHAYLFTNRRSPPESRAQQQEHRDDE